MSRFSEKYVNEVAPALMKKFGYSSVMQIPKFNKIVINVGAGDAKENSKVIDNIIDEITLISKFKTEVNIVERDRKSLFISADFIKSSFFYHKASCGTSGHIADDCKSAHIALVISVKQRADVGS